VFAATWPHYVEEAASIEGVAAALEADVIAAAGGRLPVLVGICVGGCVALECARLLAGRFGVAPPLILIDSTHPQWRSQVTSYDYTRALLRQLRIKVPYHLRVFARKDLRERASYIANRARAFRTYHGERRAALRQQAGSVARVLQAAAVRYVPAPWEGPVLLVGTRGRRVATPMMGWTGILTGKVEEAELPFAPAGALSADLIDETARALSAWLERSGT
jgi:thioesterase domain-containing protein